MEITIHYAVEDALSEAVLMKLMSDIHGSVCLKRLGKNYPGGKSPILSNLDKYINLAQRDAVFIFIDLDDAECAPSECEKLFASKNHPPLLAFRFAVREVESWVLSDRRAFAKYFKMSLDSVSSNPDSIPSPKEHLLDLVKKKSRDRDKKQAILPKKNATAQVGLGYNTELTRFVKDSWLPANAIKNSDSLRRAMDAMQYIVNQSNQIQ